MGTCPPARSALESLLTGEKKQGVLNLTATGQTSFGHLKPILPCPTNRFLRTSEENSVRRKNNCRKIIEKYKIYIQTKGLHSIYHFKLIHGYFSSHP